MHLAADLRTLALLGGSVAAMLVLLYLLRPRRRRIEVPFGGLWKRVLAQSEARVLGTQFLHQFGGYVFTRFGTQRH